MYLAISISFIVLIMNATSSLICGVSKGNCYFSILRNGNKGEDVIGLAIS